MRKTALNVQSVVLAIAIVVGFAATGDAHAFACRTHTEQHGKG